MLLTCMSNFSAAFLKNINPELIINKKLVFIERRAIFFSIN